MKLFQFFGFLLLAANCFASNVPIEFSEMKIQGKQIEYILDEKSNFSVSNLPHQKFQKYTGATLNFGFLKGTVWLKWKPKFSFREPLVMEFKNPNLDRIEFYTKRDNQYHLKSSTGDEYAFNRRERDHRFFQFNINEKEEVLVRIDNRGDQLYIPISIFSEQSLAKRDYLEQFIIGIYYGILLFVFLLNLFIYIVIRERANLFYLLYIFGLIVLQMALGGFGFEFIWPRNPFIANHSLPFLATISVLFLVFFVQNFLSTKTNLPAFNKGFNVFSFFLTINLALSIVPVDWCYQFSILVVNGITLFLTVLILPVAIILHKRKFKPARFFLGAFLALIVAVFAFVLRNFGIAPSNIFTDYSLQLGSAIEVILLTFAIVDRFKTFKQDAFNRLEEMNDLKNRQNEQLEIQVKDRTKEVLDQKEIVDHKNKQIIDSINYSKRIQNAILPSAEKFKNKFNDAFVFFQPKDIVSGDFYWASETKMTVNNTEKECMLFTVGDCTGHGVPGAIISVLGLRILMATVNHPEVQNTGDVLNYLNREMSQLFNTENGEIQIRDGMDIAVCAFDKKNGQILFSGAKNGIYLLRAGEILEFKGDKHVIGLEDEKYRFSFQMIAVFSGDRIYMSSDGFADQFGGPGGKKMKPSMFRQEIKNTAHLSLQEQGLALDRFFNNWKGSLYEQTDDVCVVGIEI